MSTSRMNSGTHNSGGGQNPRREGMRPTPLRKYPAATWPIGATSVASSTIASRTPRTSVLAGTRAIAGARMIVVACLAACSIGLADGRAGNAIGEVAGPTASNEANCGRHGHPRGANAALRAGGAGAYSAPIDGKGAADIPIWKAITLGTHDSANSLREALNAAGCRIGRLAGEALARPAFTVSPSKVDVDLVVLSVGQLGFDAEGASYAEIHARAAQLGLELCPPEVGPQLRLQYVDQPLGEFLHIAMAPVLTDSEDVVGLSVGNGGAGLLLVGFDARPNLAVSPPLRFVFLRPG
jgi:hypothetical protein